MEPFTVITDPTFTEKLAAYPAEVQPDLRYLRQLVHEVAREVPVITRLTETLKWGEPSFITPQGSTLRMDWTAKHPEKYAFYVSCSSQLIPTFRVVFGEELAFAGDRAIVFKRGIALPTEAVKSCVKTALTYHKVKQLPLLGL